MIGLRVVLAFNPLILNGQKLINRKTKELEVDFRAFVSFFLSEGFSCAGGSCAAIVDDG
jgi:hypothetical protein